MMFKNTQVFSSYWFLALVHSHLSYASKVWSSSDMSLLCVIPCQSGMKYKSRPISLDLLPMVYFLKYCDLLFFYFCLIEVVYDYITACASLVHVQIIIFISIFAFPKYLSSLECHSHLYLPICFLSCIHCFIVSLHGQAFQRNKPQGEFPSLSPFSSRLTSLRWNAWPRRLLFSLLDKQDILCLLFNTDGFPCYD